ncbi:hypothetical protein MYSE111917_16580 [Mycobacterium senriense]|uniref:Uncharacterized protein n=1 Tax=Mycobacterium senriense TaxID=2775496 RepID=A0ABN6INH9_9MYCO|nr:hypothetical protein [Mycobacterium senriense]BCZ24861.1 hypothetical protein MTY59_47160 [Mycobacterium senriense]
MTNTWRNFAAQLTPDQVAQFERMQLAGVPDADPALAAATLDLAIELAAMNRARTMPAREIVDQLVNRIGEAETRRRLGLPASTDLYRRAEMLDGGR